MALHTRPPASVSGRRGTSASGAFVLVDVDALPSGGRWSPPAQGTWTYDDVIRLPTEGMRREVIEGWLYMAPAPETGHQDAVLNIAVALKELIRRQGGGRVFVAPIDLLLDGRRSALQPDVVYIGPGKEHVVTAANLVGAPDLVVEVLSPGNSAHDRELKRRIYAEAGIPEYWIVDPRTRLVEVYRPAQDGTAAYGPPQRFVGDDVIVSSELPSLRLKAKAVFET